MSRPQRRKDKQQRQIAFKQIAVVHFLAICVLALGVKVSIATTLERSKGGQFAVHAKALPAKSWTGIGWKPSCPTLLNAQPAQHSPILADDGYRGHNAQPAHTFKVFTSS